MNRRDAFKAMCGLPIATTITRIDASELKHGDVIAIEVPGKVTLDSAERIRAHAQQSFPNHKVIVLADGMKVRVIAGA